MDYTSWTLEELEQLERYLATRGAAAEEKDAVLREIQRRRSAAPSRPGEIADKAGENATNTSPSIASMKRVGVALRFVALLIDGAIFFVLGLVIALMSGGAHTSSTAGVHTAGFHVGGLGFLALALIGFVYYVSCEVLLGGTLGKLALGLRVVDEEGGSITWGASVVRNLIRIVDGLFFYLVGAIAIWSSPCRQRLGDRAAHTYVVHT